jgi:hypothetical protein
LGLYHVRFGFDALVDFLSMHCGLPWCLDAKPDLVALDPYYFDSYVMANNYGLANSTRQDKHCENPPWCGAPIIKADALR